MNCNIYTKYKRLKVKEVIKINDKSTTTFILYVAGITLIITSALIGFKMYDAFKGILEDDTRLFYGICIFSGGLIIGTLFIAFAELLNNVKQINHKLSLLTYDRYEEKIIKKEG